MNQARAGDSMTEYYSKKKVDKIIDEYEQKLRFNHQQLETQKQIFRSIQNYNMTPWEDADTIKRQLGKKIKNLRKTVKQQSKCIQRMSNKITELDRDTHISDDLSKNDYLHFVNWHKYAKEQMKKYHVMGGREGLSIIADYAPVFYLSPNVDDPYSMFGLLGHSRFRFATDCTQYDWLRGAWSSCPKVYSPFGEDFILVEWLDAPNGKSLLGWIKVEPAMDLHFYR